MSNRHVIALMLALSGSVVGSARADEGQPGGVGGAGGGEKKVELPQPPKVDLGTQPTLYVVGYAHLDTEWRWAYPQTIREFIADTLHQNFTLIDKYPSYVFNFSGSRRYQMMREYYPAEYERLKGYIAKGRWFPCGSSVDENDANVPSAESFVRHVLYGNKYFKHEFGVTSEEYMLPDCFGFPASLPSLLKHCGLKGFSTQKLTWGLAIGQIPFKVGLWEGPDGQSIVSALDPGAYVGEVKENLAESEGWAKRIDTNGSKSGVFADYHYFGTGDQGGGPKESSVEMVEKSVHTEGHTKVVSGPADWMFKTITPDMAAGLPKYKGELELTEHSSGSITSAAYMKRCNRKNELLADAAERAAVGAWWAGAGPYPGARLEDAWYLVLGSQMHDILPGTSLPKAYEFAWNDEILAANEFADVLTRSVGSISSGMDTRGEGGDGVSVVFYNPLATGRTDVVEVTLPWEGEVKGLEAVGPGGRKVPVQILEEGSGWVRAVLTPTVPSAGFAVFNVRAASGPADKSAVTVGEKSIENERYVVKIDDNGDVASIFDKSLMNEMLTGPARLGLHFEKPHDWPAWNQDWADRKEPAKSFVSGPAKVTVAEAGPVRGALRVEREFEGSTYVQEIRLSAGGDTIVFHTHIDWATRERSLRAHFPLAAGNGRATYDIQTGVIERPNNTPKAYERAAHQWMDLTDASGSFGVSILNDCKYASDKPDDHTLRLTLLYTPGVRGNAYQDQGTQDLGRHDMDYAFYSHASDWRVAQTPWHAARLNQPVQAFVVPKHEGALGKSFSLVACDNPNVMVTAVKKAEDSDEIVVRLRELSGTAAEGVRLRFAATVSGARELDGQEREIGKGKVEGGEVVADVRGYGLAAYGVTLEQRKGSAPVRPSEGATVAIAYDTDVASTNAKRDDGEMEPGRAYPAEQLPKELVLDTIKFQFGSTEDGKPNALACKGQEIALPSGEFERVEILAASSAGDVAAVFGVGSTTKSMTVQNWRGYVGQWDNRRWGGNVPELAFQWTYPFAGLDPGYVKRDAVAWYCSHHHAKNAKGEMIDDCYQYSYIFRYVLDLPKGATSVRLPNTPAVKVFAMTAVRGSHDQAVAATPLRDTLADHVQDPVRITPSGEAKDSVLVRIEPRLYWRTGATHYTMDGTDPKPTSPAYERPFWLSQTVTIKAATFDYAGKPGPTTERKIDVDDRTGPSVKSATTVYQSPTVRIEFSEPVDRAAAGAPESYAIAPASAKVTGVELAPDSCSAVLALDKPLVSEQPVTLTITGVKDQSPAGNAMAKASVTLSAHGPVYRLEVADAAHAGSKVEGLKKLPTRAAQPWTINMFVKSEKQPTNRTVLAGFGKCEQATIGAGRYITKFADGIHFWSHNSDVEGKTPLDLGKWQMLTVTYDGSTIRLYKNGEKIAEQAVTLADDEPVVNVMPTDPWEHRLKFDGQMREFTIWDSCLTGESLRSIHASFKAP